MCSAQSEINGCFASNSCKKKKFVHICDESPTYKCFTVPFFSTQAQVFSVSKKEKTQVTATTVTGIFPKSNLGKETSFASFFLCVIV